MISTQDLTQLPTIAGMKALSQSLALLDAIISPEWHLRYYSFNSQWAEGEAMASMRDGSGDGYFLLFTSAGAIMKGFVDGAAMNPYQSEPPQVWEGVLDAVPEDFAEFLVEPAFSLEETTFCLWRSVADMQWQRGEVAFPKEEDSDGSAYLLALLNGNPLAYQSWAEEYYEQKVDLAAVEHVYRLQPLTEAVVKSLNAQNSLRKLRGDLEEIGYRQFPAGV